MPMRRASSLLVAVALLCPTVSAAANSKQRPLLHRSSAPPHCDAAQAPWWQLRGGATPCAAPPPKAFSLESMRGMHPVLLALLGTSFGWFMTALGSAAVIIHRFGIKEKTYRKVLDFMLGMSGGVMTAASYWSLLAPALEFAELQGWGQYSYVPVALGFLSGGALLQITDWWLTRMQGSLEELDLYKGLAVAEADEASGRSKGKMTRLRRLLMLIIAITIHNFPEGMAVGVAFGLSLIHI